MTTTNTSFSGLSSDEARINLAAAGYNELAPPHPHHFYHVAGEILHEPMFLLLLAAVGIYLLL
jgi:Ca2+-transporting ATPase